MPIDTQSEAATMRSQTSSLRQPGYLRRRSSRGVSTALPTAQAKCDSETLQYHCLILSTSPKSVNAIELRELFVIGYEYGD
jgi:hypothetical protein